MKTVTILGIQLPTGSVRLLESPANIRRYLALAAVASVALLVYASFVPLDYTPISWEESRQRWREIQWLNLQLFNRADWVANALVVLPSGLLAAAAVDWGRGNRWPLVLSTPLIAVSLAMVVIGIELTQVWFPTRTVSLNDIVAGCAGAVLGPVIWIIGGRFIERGISGFLTLPHWEDRLQWLCIGYMLFILVYSVLPLDLVLTRQEWEEKLASGRVSWNPFERHIISAQSAKQLILGAARMVPLGLLLALGNRRRYVGWSLFLLPIGLELLQLPVFSKQLSTFEIVGGWLGGWLAYLAGIRLQYFTTLLRSPTYWGIAWLVAFSGTLFLLLANHDQIIRDPAIIAERYNSAWSMPLVKYYAGSEYGAYTSMLTKMALFGFVGVACCGWMKNVSPVRAHAIFLVSLSCVTVAAFAVELIQVVLPPLVPDFSDGITYLSGYLAGYVLATLLWNGASSSVPDTRYTLIP